MVEDGMELYYQAVGRMNDHIKKKKAAAAAKMKKNQEDVAASGKKIDASNLEKTARDDPRGWIGESVVMCCFVLMGLNKSDKKGPTREWRHKLVTSFKFFQGMNSCDKNGHTQLNGIVAYGRKSTANLQKG
eukprot:9268036-Ditylum_brightwellii.AAC.1